MQTTKDMHQQKKNTQCIAWQHNVQQ